MQGLPVLLQMRVSSGILVRKGLQHMPDARLGVEIDNTRIVEVMPIAYGASGTIDLAAIERGQRRAIVNLYVLRGRSRKLLTSITVRDLPAFPNRRALLRLRASVDRAGELRVRLDLEDRPYHDQRIDARRYMRRLLVPLIAAAAAALILAALLVILLGGIGPSAEPRAADDREAPEAAAAAGEEQDEAPAVDIPPAGGDGDADEAPADAAAGAEDDGADAGAGAGDRTVDGGDGDASDTAADRVEDAQPAAEDRVVAEESPALGPAEWSVYFAPDSPVLDANARSRLAAAAERLAAYPSDASVRIIGHTALAGTEQGRYDLSRQRAQNAFAYLQSAGWEARQAVTVQGIGGEQPVTRDPERQELNRRVEITVEP